MKSSPIRRQIIATERAGVSFVRDIIESRNSVFSEIDRASDYGHDALVLLVVGEKVTAKQIALQIKSGESYFAGGKCSFKATYAQMFFWARHDLTTIAVVYSPKEGKAWWSDLQQEAAHAIKVPKEAYTVAFEKSQWNEFDGHGWEKVLVPTLLGQSPAISKELAIEWASNSDEETHDLGVRILFARYWQDRAIWLLMLDMFLKRDAALSYRVPLTFARIMGHPDYTADFTKVDIDMRGALRAKILRFGKQEVIKLLGYCDGDFDRGTFGYSLFATIPALPEALSILKSIAEDEAIDREIVENAKLLLQIQAHDPHWWGIWQRNSQF